MKFCFKIFWDRDYSLFEIMHFRLPLPHTVSSFPQTISASVSGWASLKSRFEYWKTKKKTIESQTFQKFNLSMHELASIDRRTWQYKTYTICLSMHFGAFSTYGLVMYLEDNVKQ